MEEKILLDNERYVWLLIGQARHIMTKARQKELAPYEIFPQQAQIIDVLYELGRKATLTELAKVSDRGVASISAQLTRMEKDGLVEKFRENRKSALKKFSLTEKGVNAHEIISKRESIRAVMSVLSEEEYQQLIPTLKKIIDSSEKYLNS